MHFSQIQYDYSSKTNKGMHGGAKLMFGYPKSEGVVLKKNKKKVTFFTGHPE